MTDSSLPVLWPGWETVKIIGHGSFGAVYEIERRILGVSEKAALKVLSIPQNESEINQLLSEGLDMADVSEVFRDYLQNITDEYKLMRQLSGHTNIVNCEDLRIVQHSDGIGWDIFIKMELLTPMDSKGDSILNEESAIQLGKNICSALILCEKNNIVHRDIKPANIFIDVDGSFKLGDFGVAKTMECTSGGTKAGTYDYMAPEVFNNLAYSSTADIYSLGIVMYWMLNQRRVPFMPLGDRPILLREREEARMKRFGGQPIPPPVCGSQELKALILKACAFDPDKRFHNAEEMLHALEALDEKTVFDETSADAGGLYDGKTVFTNQKSPELRDSSAKKHPVAGKALIYALSALILIGLWGFAVKHRISRSEDPDALAGTGETLTIRPQTEYSLGDMSFEEEVTALSDTVEETNYPVCIMCGTDKGSPESGTDDLTLWGNKKLTRSEVRSISFSRQQGDLPDEAWDVSEADDGSVMAWMNGADLFIASQGNIAPADGRGFFAGFESAISIDFGGCFDTSDISDMSYMFEDCRELREIDLSDFDTYNVTDMAGMFRNCSKLNNVDVSSFNTLRVSTMTGFFEGCVFLESLDLSSFNTANVVDMGSFFKDCRALRFIDLSSFDTSECSAIDGMFSGCASLEKLDVHGFNTQNIKTFKDMFKGCSGLTEIDIFPVNGINASDLSGMFDGCSMLAYVDMSRFVTENVREISRMFNNCSSLTSLDLCGISTGTVTDMSYMFNGCSSLKSLKLGGLDTSAVVSFEAMFNSCHSLEDVDFRLFFTPAAINVSYMFYGCSALKDETVSVLNFSSSTQRENFMDPGRTINGTAWDRYFF